MDWRARPASRTRSIRPSRKTISVSDDISTVELVTSAIAVAAFVLSFVTVVAPWLRRPRLTLVADREHSHVEREGGLDVPYLRLPVGNWRRRRSAHRARVVLDGFRHQGDETLKRIGSPFLAWPSVFGQQSDAYVDVLFAGTERPVGIGRFYRAVKVGDSVQRDSANPKSTWWLHIELPGSYEIGEQRDWLPAGAWELRLIVGADQADARLYSLKFSWGGATTVSAEDVLEEVMNGMTVKRLRRWR